MDWKVLEKEGVNVIFDFSDESLKFMVKGEEVMRITRDKLTLHEKANAREFRLSEHNFLIVCDYEKYTILVGFLNELILALYKDGKLIGMFEAESGGGERD
jgi:hypothetical protein